ncbi:hypothetical protein NHF50_11690 [Flavobacterium sp. NRK F10]|uniref:hypothetical protein n=1 Tax=Flavobacterium sp. NRK F10 TaxID=2954931 RepID=UPI002090A9D0|nr:hypothetical protein [Flavobacterium sp. NRK F10]MCO6175703.1 hypothetical protein [Flavobacterium sp. NRK F10]
MKANKRMKWMVFLCASAFLLFSCANEESSPSQETAITTSKVAVKTTKKRTEDMMIFRTKLNEILEMQQKKADRMLVQEALLSASQDFLIANEIDIKSITDETQTISKAFALYSSKMNMLNPTKN